MPVTLKIAITTDGEQSILVELEKIGEEKTESLSFLLNPLERNETIESALIKSIRTELTEKLIDITEKIAGISSMLNEIKSESHDR